MSMLLIVERDEVDIRTLMRVNAAYRGRTSNGAVSVDKLVSALEECEAKVRASARALYSRYCSKPPIDGASEGIERVFGATSDVATGEVLPVATMLAELGGVRVFVSSSDPLTTVDEDLQTVASSRTSCTTLLASVGHARISVLEMDTGMLLETSAPTSDETRESARAAVARSYQACKR